MFYHRKIMIGALLTTLSCLSAPLFAADEPTPTTETPPPTTETPPPTAETPPPTTETPPATTTDETDNMPQGANRFSMGGKSVEKNLDSVADVDFFKFSLRDPGNIVLELSQKAPRTDSSIGWRVDLYSGKDLAHGIATILAPETALSSTVQQGLGKGDYYIKISSLNPQNPALTPYNLKATFEKGDYFEKSPNQTPANATIAQFNQRYVGNLSYTSEVDYYRFSLTADDLVSIKLNQDNPGVNSTLGWTLTLFSSQSLDVPLQSVNMTETMTSASLPASLPLTAGVYYLRVNSLNPQGVSSNNYQLTVNATSQGDPNMVCAEVIAYGQHPVTARWVAFPTPCDIPVGWVSQLTPPEGVSLQATASMKRPRFAAETSLLDIPAVEIPNATGIIEVYQAQLRLISTQPTYQFELVPSSLAAVK